MKLWLTNLRLIFQVQTIYCYKELTGTNKCTGISSLLTLVQAWFFLSIICSAVKHTNKQESEFHRHWKWPNLCKLKTANLAVWWYWQHERPIRKKTHHAGLFHSVLNSPNHSKSSNIQQDKTQTIRDHESRPSWTTQKSLLESAVLSKTNKDRSFKQAKGSITVLKKERRKLEKDPEEKITSGGSGNERPVVVLGFLLGKKGELWPLEK